MSFLCFVSICWVSSTWKIVQEANRLEHQKLRQRHKRSPKNTLWLLEHWNLFFQNIITIHWEFVWFQNRKVENYIHNVVKTATNTIQWTQSASTKHPPQWCPICAPMSFQLHEVDMISRCSTQGMAGAATNHINQKHWDEFVFSVNGTHGTSFVVVVVEYMEKKTGVETSQIVCYCRVHNCTHHSQRTKESSSIHY